ncbi:MAG: hypothetical protein EOP08_04900, partial [Proteobacteria bacterium]
MPVYRCLPRIARGPYYPAPLFRRFKRFAGNSMSAVSFAGLHVAIVTPFRAGGEVDWAAWTRLVDFHVQQGTDGLVIAGTTGESVTLEDGEVRELVLRAQAQANGRLRIVVGAGTSSTAGTVRRVQEFTALPVDGVLV